MLYSELNHLIRAARDVLNGEAVYIVGSQAIVPWLKKNEGIPPKSYNSCLTFSREADIIPFSGSEDGATEIDGSIGEDSLFDAMITEKLVHLHPVTHQLPKLAGIISDKKMEIVGHQILNRFEKHKNKKSKQPSF